MSVYCSKCGAENQDDARFCFECGARFVEAGFRPEPARHNFDVKKPDAEDLGEKSSPAPPHEDHSSGIDGGGRADSVRDFTGERGEEREFRQSYREDYGRYGEAPKMPEIAKAEEPKLEFASFGLRLGAWVLDWIVLSFMTQIAVLAAGIRQPANEDMSQFMSDYMASIMSGTLHGSMADYFQNMMLTFFIMTMVCLAYYVVFHTIGGQTLGKLALGIRVARRDGSAIGIGRSLLRYIIYWIGSKPFYWGAFPAMFGKEAAAVHDHAADTRVYKVASLEAYQDFHSTSQSSGG